ncbi:MAG TPA: ABC transporter permease [Acidimicrobiales bacterium]
MSNLLPFVVVGLASGALYGLAGTGLVLTYKTSGVFNFAHGAVASAGAYAFYELRTQRGLPWPVAAALCLVVVGPAMGLGLERLGRALADASSAMRVVATVGLMLAIQGGLQMLYGTTTRTFDPFLPTTTFRLFGVVIGWDQVLVVVVALAATAGLAWFFRKSPLGMAMRAVVDDRDLLELSGTSSVLVSQAAWAIGSTFAVATGVLIAPSLGLDAILLTLLVVQAFGAAAVGAFSSLARTFAGGLVIGVLAAITQRYVGDVPTLIGVPASLPFIVLFVALLIQRTPHVSERLQVARDNLTIGVSRSSTTLVGAVLAGVAVIALPSLVGPRLPIYTQGVVFVLVFLSLGLLVRTSGQVSLCHAGFVAVGAAAFAHLTSGAGLPWLIALVAAGCVTVPIGALVAIPAIRLSGVHLALATFGFGILLQRLAYPSAAMFGTFGFRSASRPALPGLDLTTDARFYAVAVIVVALCTTAIVVLRRGRLGRLLLAMSDSPAGLEATGVSVNTARVLVFCAAAFFAGIAGALFSAATGSADQNSYDAFASLLWLAVLAISGRGPLRSAVVAALLLTVVPSYIEGDVAQLQLVVFGSAAIWAAVASARTDASQRRLDSALSRAREGGPRSPFGARRNDPGWRSPLTDRAPERVHAAAGR